MKTIIISGSSRRNGDTTKVVTELSELLNTEIIHLIDFNISHYDYEHKNADDDFLEIINKLISDYNTFVFATPVYWYSMSGIMKVFFDRLSDLLTVEKDLGRQLRGKNMAVITSSIGNHLGDNFWLPFKATADYLDMNYLGNTHTIAEENNTKTIINFIQFLK